MRAVQQCSLAMCANGAHHYYWCFLHPVFPAVWTCHCSYAPFGDVLCMLHVWQVLLLLQCS